MKVAYIAPFLDGTGYSNAAISLIECLDSVGIDVVPLWITLSNNPKGTSDKIKSMYNKTLDNVDVIIQNSLPEHFVKHGSIPSVGVFFWETTHFKGSNWQYHLNLMDQVWCFNPDHVKACVKSGVKGEKIKEISQPRDISVYTKDYDPIPFPNMEHLYKFYHVGEISYRKNTAGLIQAYLREFTAQDPVCLIIKGFVDNIFPEQSEKQFEEMVKEIKHELRLETQRTPPIVIISSYLTNNEMLRLHKSCDCFVTFSRGECWCLPLVDALGFGNPCIAPDWNGPAKILSGMDLYKVSSLIEKPIYGMKKNHPRLYNRDETWFDSSVEEGAKLMRYFFNLGKTKDQEQIKKLNRFSYDSIGPLLKQNLQQLVK